MSSKALPIIEDLFHKIIGPFMATKVDSLLREPELLETRIQVLVQYFEDHPHLMVPFKALVKSLHSTETEISFEEQVRFYTTKHTRDWIMVTALNHVLNLKELKLDEVTGRLPGQPADLLKYAHKAREAFGDESRYKDVAFSAGLLFDFIFYLQRTPFLDLGQTKYDDYINQCFTLGITQGKLVTQLSRHKAKLSLEEIAPITPLIRQLCQVVFVVLKQNDAINFYKKLETLKPTEPARMALEHYTFGAHTGMVGSFIAQSLSVFNHLGEAMSVWGFPYLSWVHAKKDIHDVAGMGELGVLLSELMKPAQFIGDGSAGKIVPELKYLDFTFTAGIKSEIKI